MEYKEVLEYRTVTAIRNIEDLSMFVNQYIRQWYSPIGGILKEEVEENTWRCSSIKYTRYTQSMVKYKDGREKLSDTDSVWYRTL